MGHTLQGPGIFFSSSGAKPPFGPALLDDFDMYMSYRPLITYDLGHRTAHTPHKFVTSRRDIDHYWYVYHVSLDEFRCFSKRYPSHALRKHMCGSAGLGEDVKSTYTFHF
jgi:hypothetical protein